MRRRPKSSVYYTKTKHVYVVLEHATTAKDSIVHGVYTDREMAEAKRTKATGLFTGYICILKKTIKGNIFSEERHPMTVLNRIFGW